MAIIEIQYRGGSRGVKEFHGASRGIEASTKSTLFVVSKDEWDTKEGPGKSMKNALYV